MLSSILPGDVDLTKEEAGRHLAIAGGRSLGLRQPALPRWLTWGAMIVEGDHSDCERIATEGCLAFRRTSNEEV